ncbi:MULTISPECIES: flagellar protein FlgN [unclassified Mesobacillus]|uniref:flagellar protein FlgN n=1 Tax=unclassified Mesobacillus TaxID=2675270 RepID=UPI00203BD977|nr:MULTISPECIES: flagellar protein FlgN [unclassified Mesobacillus]MCM3124134.1 flagellar protein FlgN [Mesobacillus sp. MER 33]MCM3233983.1 flagellar protein FlgN [Mesobacillus sp. MER 48]
MSVESLISIMDKLNKMHKSLYELTVKKTGIVKKGDTAALDQLLKDEQAHMAAINKLEQERTAVSNVILPGASLQEIAEANPAGKDQLLQIKKDLLNVIIEIKARNELNQQLIHQSLQFINFSKSLVMPQEKEINYKPPAGKKAKPGQSPGMFNSKA